eukprot:TRINITY_DN8671_c1_g1_i2.p1 TRINITY_DN8671_c1_g1~~TRINITY_DN8671_c1_g1_i2.p1  ORF type:complete len:102 (-),score=22.18 TRINITY_DN8671_c1_g1_i2:1-306(-)
MIKKIFFIYKTRKTLLGQAVYNDKKEHVKLLLEYKANPNLLGGDVWDVYPLDLAKNEEMVKLLVNHGAHRAYLFMLNKNRSRGWIQNAQKGKKKQDESYQC